MERSRAWNCRWLYRAVAVSVLCWGMQQHAQAQWNKAVRDSLLPLLDPMKGAWTR
ncbi:MAG: hypothetical protein IPG92_11720 [Flavobacteriales bacterium]|nr:hypothetical protein [Flavobacteriales bacterium]